jgi:hypothetical protein
MRRRWSIVRKSDNRFFARSQSGRLVGFMTREGLASFLSSRGAKAASIRQAISDLEAQQLPARVGLDLDEGWR